MAPLLYLPGVALGAAQWQNLASTGLTLKGTLELPRAPLQWGYTVDKFGPTQGTQELILSPGLRCATSALP